jgi:hypothetical protein
MEWLSRWLNSMGRLFVRQRNDSEPLELDEVDALRIARHAKFRTALPLPPFDWTDDKSIEHSLNELRDYAEQLANGALDWYLDKKTSKKRLAACLHWWTYIFGVLAVLIPLLMLNLGKVFDPFVKQYFGIDSNLGSIAAEAAILIAGIAGGATLIDRAAGFTADWMRYITTAARINRTLIEFQFEWNKLDCNSPYPPRPVTTGSAGIPSPPARKAKKAADPIAQRIELAGAFCSKIFELMDQETSIWASELKERVAQMARQLPTHNRS